MSKIIGIGTDILEIERFKKSLERSKSLKAKIFTEKELLYCAQYKQSQVLHLAGRFVAKEAIAKAFGTGFGKDLSFLDLEILNDEKGKPTVKFSKTLAKKFGPINILVSISHSKTVATAFALVEKN